MYKMLILTIFVCLFTCKARAQVCRPPASALEKACARNPSFDSYCNNHQQGFVALDDKNCLTSPKVPVIKEIITLPFMATVPNSIYTQYPAKVIAENLVYRFYQSNDLARMSMADIIEPGYDLYHDTSLLMAIKANNFSSILNLGFLNQFQTGNSGGTFSPSARAIAENRLIGLTLDSINWAQSKILNSVRPKYAYLTFDVDKESVGSSWLGSQYGSVFIRFKDEVKKRSTFSNGDSLDHFWRPANYNYSYNDFQSFSFFYSKKDFALKNLGNYYEAQIWGPLTIEDVDYILVGCIKGLPSFQDEIISQLKIRNLNTPVFNCESRMGRSKFLTFKQTTKLYPE